MNILFSTVLMILTILFILFPFIRRSHTTLALSDGRSSESINQKDLILGTLGEIELDYHMDKLSREDYRALKNHYAHAAVDVLQAENSNINTKDDRNLLGYNHQDIEEEIEKELEAMNLGEHK